MTDGYMKDCCKVVERAVNRLEQLERALDGLDLFMDIWESGFDTVAPDGLDKTLWDVQASAHIYLDGFRAALAEPVEIPAESETETEPDAAVSAANAAQPAVSSADGAMPERMNFWYESETTDRE